MPFSFGEHGRFDSGLADRAWSRLAMRQIAGLRGARSFWTQDSPRGRLPHVTNL